MPDLSHKPRISVKEAATLRHAAMEDTACTIVDVSGDGFRLAVPRGVRCGTGYTLRFASEEHDVAIRWASLGEAGGLFLD